MKAYLYDFDKTICPGDSGSDFWLFCLARMPWLVIFMPIQMVGGVCYLLGIFKKLQRICSIHCYIRAIDTEKYVNLFWDKRQKKLYPYFADRKRDLPTVVCSASPDFLLRPLCDRLGAEYLIATRVDPRTGRILSNVCKKAEKLVRLAEELPDCEYPEVYSDSLKNDIHILRLGESAFHVRDGVPYEINVRQSESAGQGGEK